MRVNGKDIDLPFGPLENGITVHNVSVTEKWVGWGRCYTIDWRNETKRLEQVLVVMKHEKSYKQIGYKYIASINALLHHLTFI